MRSKRIIGLLVAAAMFTSMVTACGSPKTTAGTSTAGAQQSTKEEVNEKAKEDVTLTIWVNPDANNEVNIAQEERFKTAFPYIKLNKVLTTEKDDFMTAFAAGNAPDYAEAGQPNMFKYIYAGVAAPLDDYLATWEDYSNINKDMVEKFALNGKHYGVPGDSYVMQLIYNKKIFAESGAKIPTTWDELITTAKLLTDPAKKQWGFNLLISQWTEWWFEYFVWQADGDLTQKGDNGEIVLTFTDPAVVKATELYRKLIAEKCIQPDITLDYGKMQSEFAAGHVAMTISGSDAVNQFSNMGMKPEDIGYAMLPKGPNGKEITQMGGSVAYVVENSDKDKMDAAWEWLKFKYSKAEIELQTKATAANGNTSPALRLRSDIDYVTLGKVDPELQAAVDKAAKDAKLEFFGKGMVGSYVDKAVQKASLDPKSDIMAVFKEQQDAAQREVVDKFNADLKK